MHHISIYDAISMPHVSRRKLDKKTEEELKKALRAVLVRIRKDQEMEDFLLSLLSDTEQMMLAKRLAIIVLLKENIPESAIADIVRVTRETVSRMKLFLELKESGYKIALKKLDEEKTLVQFKKILLSLARYSVRAAGGYVKPSILD